MNAQRAVRSILAAIPIAGLWILDFSPNLLLPQRKQHRMGDFGNLSPNLKLLRPAYMQPQTAPVPPSPQGPAQDRQLATTLQAALPQGMEQIYSTVLLGLASIPAKRPLILSQTQRFKISSVALSGATLH
jgi:hypothetical protein